MSFSHLVILAIILIIVIPPEKLPEVMRNIGRMFNDLRRSTSGVFDELKKEAEFRPSDMLKPQPPHQPAQPPQQAQQQAPTQSAPVNNLDETGTEKSDESKS